MMSYFPRAEVKTDIPGRWKLWYPVLRTLLSKSRLPSLAHDFLSFLPLATTRVFTLDFKDISLINDPAS